ncbi:hypothetical protein EPUS_02446 [Endocarpon pusillum Z07020]|uniref:Uncharacterized protein n=1 Tax=Endocarpon pusillum (strain Z07020 / HMAS-L-300199) TaxID=1263415 RepID=U1GFN5_ENDPU|nr:uncharacterized protein EPUS_02446 [Endocarpon pusillum Z07020]ERF70923.1 hypothetical protein EPUS_02446 [Endocarpon pusillum Z07020]
MTLSETVPGSSCAPSGCDVVSELAVQPNTAELLQYGSGKRGHSPSTKKRLAESNARYYELQKQCGKELKEMIPKAILVKAEAHPGSKRELLHTMNALKLYITGLLEDKKRLQEQIMQSSHSMNIRKSCDKEVEIAPGLRSLWPRPAQQSGIKVGNDDKATAGATAVMDVSDLGREEGKVIGRLPEVNHADGTLPETPTPEISPYDSLLRQAVEKLIALTKERAMGSQGVLDNKQIDRLNIVHDCIVEMVEDMGRE